MNFNRILGQLVWLTVVNFARGAAAGTTIVFGVLQLGLGNAFIGTFDIAIALIVFLALLYDPQSSGDSV